MSEQEERSSRRKRSRQDRQVREYLVLERLTEISSYFCSVKKVKIFISSCFLIFFVKATREEARSSRGAAGGSSSSLSKAAETVTISAADSSTDPRITER